MLAETDIVVCKVCRRLFIVNNHNTQHLKLHAWNYHIGFSPDVDDIHEVFDFIKGIGYE